MEKNTNIKEQEQEVIEKFSGSGKVAWAALLAVAFALQGCSSVPKWETDRFSTSWFSGEEFQEAIFQDNIMEVKFTTQCVKLENPRFHEVKWWESCDISNMRETEDDEVILWNVDMKNDFSISFTDGNHYNVVIEFDGVCAVWNMKDLRVSDKTSN